VTVLIDRAVDLKMLRLHAERLADIALTEPETRTSIMPVPGGHPPPSIELQNVSYRYSEQDPWVLDNINLRIEAGVSVAITGPSGGGKSTLLKLLAGLIQPSHGKILIDGEPLGRIGIENYRARIGVVMQDDQLFAGSITDNISFFSERPDHERIVQCAKQAAIHDEIMAMPMGYGTLIGDMGTVLSGGQKQRVVIARALYRQPSILLLDEATSHLDVERERMVNVAFRTMGVTRVVIAHRPETIRMSGCVIALEQSKLVEANMARQSTTVENDVNPNGEKIVRRSRDLRGGARYETIRSDTSEQDPPREHKIKALSARRRRSRNRECAPIDDAGGETISITPQAERELRLPEAKFEMPSHTLKESNRETGEQDDSQGQGSHPLRSAPQQSAMSGDRTLPLSVKDPEADRLKTWGRTALALSAYFLMGSFCL
jgi:ATP-binding cassette, subfamily B, bacterial CvaB/MchF/RaxB